MGSWTFSLATRLQEFRLTVSETPQDHSKTAWKHHETPVDKAFRDVLGSEPRLRQFLEEKKGARVHVDDCPSRLPAVFGTMKLPWVPREKPGTGTMSPELRKRCSMASIMTRIAWKKPCKPEDSASRINYTTSKMALCMLYAFVVAFVNYSV